MTFWMIRYLTGFVKKHANPSSYGILVSLVVRLASCRILIKAHAPMNNHWVTTLSSVSVMEMRYFVGPCTFANSCMHMVPSLRLRILFPLLLGRPLECSRLQLSVLVAA